ncbi:hydroxymethylglutaryl-CoA reductase, degradative [Liquorilactobacillus satsumensis]|uniref:3-hydroxy-3-methylglutaryl coenzyme A reductase n=1 Tax=Liquorilactobacillus satsumensis DSM 16230 = JCM 12392 TaxID=1423801 RepID=A0A0R1VAT9_9LACO|nr:hydroxymethylglutaryl-CoA reductase, degradative [Liquorilactobacillus satsumensis]KRM00083.1 3-hydroxy-3-methylglutaryl-coenzyme A reductase 3-hydroxy-3-methylglutaryl-coenzyme Auctase [Liquorilactobacillus satsumensis DSM 16230 = JCM 12392]MCC7667042.1 hydroxymethylglutaryl-CoA reductase, degradative [Liquorilactobacillus satsumensis]MCP9313282.1 hydroxymethylglutaryl-CoA reductase, degradative [Liquorilactobacillus satsumensis]MCP9329598.1 hydroxymethylglutaryl-CoA reductase, degradative 
MQEFGKFYQKTRDQRLRLLRKFKITAQQEEVLRKQAVNPALGDTMIENYLTDYTLPEGLSFHYLIDGEKYLVPMVTEEPSVIAASSHGASLVEQAGGFSTKLTARLLLGQIVIENVQNMEQLCSQLEAIFPQLLETAQNAHPSLSKRGGGARWLRTRPLSADLLSLDLAVDVQEAMGANMMNTMLEAVAQEITQRLGTDVLLAVLSNYATECLVTASCRIPIDVLAKGELAGETVAKKIVQASRVAQLDPYRAATHNKGIMNGIDAVVLATGNDWRAIESGIHAFATRTGSYRGLSTWELTGGSLVGKLTIPAPVGFVGGSIGIVPLVAVNHELLQLKSARNLEKVIVSVGLAQNLAALYALVTEGIQRGHMRLQLKSLILTAGAAPDEVAPLMAQLLQSEKQDLAAVSRALQAYRKGRES